MFRPRNPTAQRAPDDRSERPLVVCASPFHRDFRWLAGRLGPDEPRWSFHNGAKRGPLDRLVRRPNLALIRAAWSAARTARTRRARLIISHDPRCTFYVALFLRMSRAVIPHVAWSFNFSQLPPTSTTRIVSRALRQVDLFIVHSAMERALYADAFRLPIDRFERMFWGLGEPPDDDNGPIVDGPYICAIGGNARDYPTLMAAVATLPEVRLVAVMRSDNARGLQVPPNAEVHVDLPLPRVQNILKHCRFTVVPLLGSDVPCGHVTIVAAMRQSRAFIISDSSGVSDYLTAPEEHALTYATGDPTSLASRIAELWHDPERATRMGRAGRAFSDAHCSEESVRDHLHEVLKRFDALTPDEVTAGVAPP